MRINKTKVALSVAITASLLQGCKPNTELRKPEPLTVSVIEVTKPVETGFRNFQGQVIPARTTNVSFRINGELDRVVVKTGQFVTKGALLAVLDSDKLTQQLTDAEVNFKLAEKQLKRGKELLSKKMVSQSEYDSLVASRRIAQVNFQQAQNNLEYSKLTAPFEGIISEVPKESYESIVAGETIVSMHRSDIVELRINISDSVLAPMNPHKEEYEAIVNFSGQDREYSMKYYKHTTEPVPETQNYELWFRMAQPDAPTPPILPGTSADIRINLGAESTSSFEVPFTALDTGRSVDEFYVWKYKNGKVNPVKVETSDVSSAGAIVSSGVNTGDLLVNSGLRNLRANANVVRATEE